MNEPDEYQLRDANTHAPCAAKFLFRCVADRPLTNKSWDAERGAWVIQEWRQRPLLPEDMCDPAAPRPELAVELCIYPRSAKDAKAVCDARDARGRT